VLTSQKDNDAIIFTRYTKFAHPGGISYNKSILNSHWRKFGSLGFTVKIHRRNSQRTAKEVSHGKRNEFIKS
jgi:hypothetical protein